MHNAEQAVTPCNSGLMLLFYSVGKSRKYEAGYHFNHGRWSQSVNGSGIVITIEIEKTGVEINAS